MPAMHDSILVKNLGENRLSQTDTVSSCICNLRIYIVIDGEVVRRKANFFSPESGIDLWSIHQENEEIGETSESNIVQQILIRISNDQILWKFIKK